MSHTFRASCVTFISNSDLSGYVTLRYAGREIELPGEALIAFVADLVRRDRISRLEECSDEEVLGLSPQATETLFPHR